MARRWRSYAMNARGSQTCMSSPCKEAHRGGSRTGTQALTGLSWTPDGREIVYSVQEPAAGRLWRIHANSAQPGRGSPMADIPAAAVDPSISRPMPGQPARLAFQTITRDVDIHMMDLEDRLVNDTIESKLFSKSTRIESVGAILVRRQSDCVRVVPFRGLGDLGRWPRWEPTSADHVTGRCSTYRWWLVAGRRKDRVRRCGRRQ